MASTNFIDKTTVIQASWAQAINDFFYTLFQGASTVQQARTALGITSPTVVEENTTSRTLVLSDADAYIVTSHASPVTVTVPSGVFPIPTTLVIAQLGDGQVTISSAPGVTVHSATGFYSTRVKYSVIGLMMVSANNWILTGDVTSS